MHDLPDTHWESRGVAFSHLARGGCLGLPRKRACEECRRVLLDSRCAACGMGPVFLLDGLCYGCWMDHGLPRYRAAVKKRERDLDGRDDEPAGPDGRGADGAGEGTAGPARA